MFSSFNARAVGLASLSARTTIELAAIAGFGGVDLLIRDLVEAGEDPTSIAALRLDHGLQAGAFPLPMDWRGDEATFRRDLAGLPRLAAVAEVLGFSRTGTWVMPETPDRVVDRRSVATLHVNRLGAIARIIGDHGIRLGLEVIGVESSRTGRGEPFVTRMADLDRELGAIWTEAANFGVLIDAFHLHAADEPVEAALAWGIDRIVWVHLADLPPGSSVLDRSRIIDAERGLPGDSGSVAIRGLLNRLNAGGYNGPVTAEPLARCASLTGLDPVAVAHRVKAALDLVWPVL